MFRTDESQPVEPAPVDTITPLELYTVLNKYKNPQGHAYWGDQNDPVTGEPKKELAWVQCNIIALPGGGSPMPKPGGLTLATDQDSVLKWVKCGMPPPGTTMGVGGAGGGGVGGAMP